MDISKWKSVAIKKADFDLLKGLCKNKFRAPGAMISKILNDYVDHQARKNKIPNAVYRTKLLNGGSDGSKKIKGKEFFTIELDLENNNITLYVNGELRNKIHTVKAEPLFDRMLKIAKLKFLKMRDQIEQ